MTVFRVLLYGRASNMRQGTVLPVGNRQSLISHWGGGTGGCCVPRVAPYLGRDGRARVWSVAKWDSHMIHWVGAAQPRGTRPERRPLCGSWKWLNDEVAKTRSVTDRAREVNRKGPRLSLNPQRLR
jgi:hypothetical protein